MKMKYTINGLCQWQKWKQTTNCTMHCVQHTLMAIVQSSGIAHMAGNGEIAVCSDWFGQKINTERILCWGLKERNKDTQ